MHVLYGVVGEGMGHATRSAVVLEHILDAGHEVRVVVSGRAHDFLRKRFARREKISVEEIQGLTLRYFGNRLDHKASLYWNLRNAPKGVKKNIEVYRKIAEDGFRPGIVVSDFESWAGLYGLRHGIPVVSVDNIQIVNRCKHERSIGKGESLDFRLARLAVKMKVPQAYYYLIATFFFPPVRRKYTTLVPPILRNEVLAARREPGEHVVVYLRGLALDRLRPILKKTQVPFRVYGAEEEGEEDNVALRGFSGRAFLDDLRTARAVIAGGGFSLMSEAVSLHVPMLAVPIEGQFEQELNARYLQHLGYGRWARELSDSVLADFLERTDEFADALSGYQREDNSLFFSHLDRLLDWVAKGKKRPNRLA